MVRECKGRCGVILEFYTVILYIINAFTKIKQPHISYVHWIYQILYPIYRFKRTWLTVSILMLLFLQQIAMLNCPPKWILQ